MNEYQKKNNQRGLTNNNILTLKNFQNKPSDDVPIKLKSNFLDKEDYSNKIKKFDFDIFDGKSINLKKLESILNEFDFFISSKNNIEVGSLIEIINRKEDKKYSAIFRNYINNENYLDFSNIERLLRIKHKNIVKIEFYLIFNNSFLIIHEHVKESISNFIKKKELEEKLIFAIFKEIYFGALSLNRYFFQHRSLCLECIYFNHKNEIKIGDLTFIKQFNKLDDQVSSNLIINPFITSPEILYSGPARPESRDLWSLGAILYCLTTGYYPYERVISKIDDLYDNLRNKNLIVDSSFKLGSMELKDLLYKTLDKNYKNRIRLEDISKSAWFDYKIKENDIQYYEKRISDFLQFNQSLEKRPRLSNSMPKNINVKNGAALINKQGNNIVPEKKIINETNFSEHEIWIKNKDLFIELFNSGLNDISKVIEMKDIIKLYNEKKNYVNSNNEFKNVASNFILNNKNLSNINIVIHNEKGLNNQSTDIKEKNILNKSNNRIAHYKI